MMLTYLQPGQGILLEFIQTQFERWHIGVHVHVDRRRRNAAADAVSVATPLAIGEGGRTRANGACDVHFMLRFTLERGEWSGGHHYYGCDTMGTAASERQSVIAIHYHYGRCRVQHAACM